MLSTADALRRDAEGAACRKCAVDRMEEEHVDYWNDLGRADSFLFAGFGTSPAKCLFRGSRTNGNPPSLTPPPLTPFSLHLIYTANRWLTGRWWWNSLAGPRAEGAAGILEAAGKTNSGCAGQQSGANNAGHGNFS